MGGRRGGERGGDDVGAALTLLYLYTLFTLHSSLYGFCGFFGFDWGSEGLRLVFVRAGQKGEAGDRRGIGVACGGV